MPRAISNTTVIYLLCLHAPMHPRLIVPLHPCASHFLQTLEKYSYCTQDLHVLPSIDSLSGVLLVKLLPTLTSPVSTRANIDLQPTSTMQGFIAPSLSPLRPNPLPPSSFKRL